VVLAIFRFTTTSKVIVPVNGVPVVESVAVTVTWYVPAGVRVEMPTLPVVAPIVTPVGRDAGDVMVKAYGNVPPVAVTSGVRVALAVPKVPV
jgi:hypothetical protein